ncbi:MAG TPA: hypothetical protein VGV38_19445, partial [Pyrinomonadaceae bacterium]|nr:hypothetical protein [Pyrinomonadaceae bacterium]
RLYGLRPFDADGLRGLAPGQMLARLYERAREANVIPPDLTLEDVGRFFEVFKTNVRAVRKYRPEPTRARVVLYRSEEAFGAGEAGESLGWRPYAGGGLEVVRVAGDHYTMVRAPHAQALALRLRERLEESRAGAA